VTGCGPADTFRQMISGLGTPVTALVAAGEKLTATANNVANVSNPTAPRDRVDLSTAAVTAGVTAHHRMMDPASSGLVDDMADLGVTHALYTANAAVLRVQDETLGSVLDVFG
jgi:flagellar basal body rod protein FlgG